MNGDAPRLEKAVPGQPIMTACGGLSTFQADTPWAVHRGRIVYFCLPAYKADFDHDPATSCLAPGRVENQAS